MGTPAHRLTDLQGHRDDLQGHRAATAPAGAGKASQSPRAEDLVRGRRVGRSVRSEETVVLDRDPQEPEIWWFGHLIDGNLGKRGRLRHDRSSHESTLLTGHDGGVFATAALLVHQACDPISVHPTYFVYDVVTQQLDMRDCGCPGECPV